MEGWTELGGAGPIGWRSAMTALLLAFTLAQVIAGAYVWTFRGLSYSRTMVQGMALGAIVTCTLLLAIGDSIAASIGLAGGLSIIRFRTTMRDPRDMVFVFASLGAGIVCGLRSYEVAISGTLVFAGAAVVLDAMSYGSRHQADGLARVTAPPEASEAIAAALRAHTRRFVLVTLRDVAQGAALEHAYQVTLRSEADRGALVAALDGIAGARDVTLHLQEPTLEL